MYHDRAVITLIKTRCLNGYLPIQHSTFAASRMFCAPHKFVYFSFFLQFLFKLYGENVLAENFLIRVHKVECIPNDEFVMNVTCWTRNIDWYTVNESMEIILKPGVQLKPIFVCITIIFTSVIQAKLEIASRLKVKLTTLVQNTNMRYVPRYLINATVDICAMLAGDTTNPLSRMLVHGLAKHANFAHPCPLSVSLVYT